MKGDKYKTQRVKVTNLLLALDNYRFNPQESQREAIKEMLKGKGGYKLLRLAEDIADEGLNPSEMLMVTPIEANSENGKTFYKVLEGNRRVTALKLLTVPETIEWPEYKDIKSRFVKLHQRYAHNPLTSVECVVFDNESDADLWIERKHAVGLQGEGIEMWDSTMRQRFNQATKGEKSIVLQTLDLLRNSSLATKEDLLLLDQLSSTNLARLLEDPYVREQIGVTKRNKELFSLRKSDEVEAMLFSIVRDISRPEFKVTDIYDKALRKKYIDDLCKKVSLPNTALKYEWKIDSQQVDEYGKSSTEGTKATDKKQKKERTSLCSSGMEISIPQEFRRANDVFNELKGLSAKKYPNIVAAMFRVLLELSVNNYIETFGLLRDGQLTANEGSTHNLHGNVNRVINDMMRKNIINKDLQKGIKMELNNPNSPLSIDSLNAYVHSSHCIPSYLSLLTGWDNVQPFFQILWHEVSTAQKSQICS